MGEISCGFRRERRLALALLATEDRKEGTAAFTDRRPVRFRNR